MLSAVWLIQGAETKDAYQGIIKLWMLFLMSYCSRLYCFLKVECELLWLLILKDSKTLSLYYLYI